MRKPAVSQILEARSIYVLPTGYGLFFALVIYFMLMGSINYDNNMGFLLTFLLAGVCLVGMLYTYRNLSALKLSAGRTRAVFAGEYAEFPIFIETVNNRPAYRIALGDSRKNAQVGDVSIGNADSVKVRVKTSQRGYLPLNRLRVWTEFPLGLFHVWSWVAIESRTLVYPKPSGVHKLPPQADMSNGKNRAYLTGNDDFAGIRRYQPGDSPNHIAWKAFARGHEVLTKQFAGIAGNDVWLDWYALDGLNVEERLSQLCQWVLDLHIQDRNYGMRLPQLLIKPNRGEPHKLACLEKLALFNQ